MGSGCKLPLPKITLIKAHTHLLLKIDSSRLPEVIPGGHSDNRVLECSVAANADYLVTDAIFWPSANMRR